MKGDNCVSINAFISGNCEEFGPQFFNNDEEVKKETCLYIAKNPDKFDPKVQEKTCLYIKQAYLSAIWNSHHFFTWFFIVKFDLVFNSRYGKLKKIISANNADNKCTDVLNFLEEHRGSGGASSKVLDELGIPAPE